MEWSGKESFKATKEVPFVVDGKEAGSLKSFGQLSFLKVGLFLHKTTLSLSLFGFTDCLIVTTNGSTMVTGERRRTHGSNGPAKSCIKHA